MNPTVTIIMATYNRAHFIVETLHSIQKQTFQNFECLIIDDGGSDNTLEVINPIISSDERFKFLKRPAAYKKGLPGCRNYGLDLAKGDYIIFFDDDDIVHPDNLKICLDVIQSNKTDFCHYQKIVFTEKTPQVTTTEVIIKNTLTIKNIEKVVNQSIGLASCTVLWQKKCFKVIRFNEDLLYAEEWECYIRIISEGFEGLIIDNVLYYNRKHPNSNTGEFYSNNPIRRASKKNAMLLVIANLEEKQLLSNAIIRYFVQIALDFKEYKLFEAILKTAKMSWAAKMKWRIVYAILPFRLYVYRLKKKILK